MSDKINITKRGKRNMSFGERFKRGMEVAYDELLQDVSVSQSFYDIIDSELNLENIRHRAFTMYLMFTTFTNDDNYPVIPCGLVKMVGNTTTAVEFLQDYSDNVMRIEWSKDWSYANGKAREITRIDWPAKVIQARITESNKKYKDEPRRFFLKGTKVTKNTIAAYRKEIEQKALAEFERAKLEQKNLLLYLNERTHRLFTQEVDKNYDKAFDLARGNKQAQAALSHIKMCSKSYYRPSRTENTLRIFTIGQSLQTVNSDIRHTLLPDWVEFDLKHAQLAVTCMLWGLELPQYDIWQSLIDHTGYSKDILKDALYSMLYGMSKRNLRTQLFARDMNINPDVFFSHPLIDMLWKERRKQYSLIFENGGMYDAFGTFIECAGDALSVLSNVMQSYELCLLLPALELAKSTDEFQITVWQHDGFTACITRERLKDLWIERIQEAVNNRARELNIPTCLTVDK